MKSVFRIFFFRFLKTLAAAMVCLAAQAGQDAAMDLEQLMEVRVQTATLQKQTLRNAPADVTVITAADIRRFGYRTLAEALASVRGFYVTHDGAFQYAGVRGFSLLGDYNTRFLVMIDGHAMTDNVYGAMYMFGQDFGLDMDLVEQIEIVRGPSSALYGSNGMFATINILTKKAEMGRTSRVSTELGSFGESKVQVSGTYSFGGSGSALFSVSGFHTQGRTAVLGNVPIKGLGNERGFHTFTKIAWKNWSFVALWNDRSTSVPTGFFGADLGDTGTRSSDNHNFAEVAWSRTLGENRAVRWRGYYDQYRYDAVYNYIQRDRAQNFDGADGDWIGQQWIYQHRTTRLGAFTLGAETSFDIRNLQYYYMVDTADARGTVYDDFRLSHPNAAYAVFAQQEWDLGQRFTLYLGGRLDGSKNNHPFVSPRVALVHKRSTTTYKMMYGKAFRNPSTFERYWEPSPALQAERMSTIEFSREQAIRKRLTLVTSIFNYRLRDLIKGVEVTENRLQYRNTSIASATGFEAELNGQPTDWLQTGASFTIQRTRGNNSDRRIENSPTRIAQFRAAVPLVRSQFVPAIAFRYLGSRYTAQQNKVGAAGLLDVTANSRRPAHNLDLQFGLRNVLDKSYSDPQSNEHVSPLLPRAGRTFFVKLTWQSE